MSFWTRFDCIFNIIYLLYSFIFLIPLTCSLFGYYGADHYKKCPLTVYCVYHTIYGSAKLIVVFWETRSNVIALNVLSGLLELYIARFVMIVIHQLNQLGEDQRNRLSMIRRAQIAMLYW